MTQWCTRCKHWHRAGAITTIRGETISVCLWPIPVLPKSAAATGKRMMGAYEGADCPCWEKRDAVTPDRHQKKAGMASPRGFEPLLPP